MKRHLLALLVLLFSMQSKKAYAAYGDTTHVVTHNEVLVVTNPSSGSNPYPSWGVFPTASVKYRKVILNLSYRCPTGQVCGEWDYLDYVYVRRKGGVNAPSENMEIARFITPYGNSFNQSWHSEFHIDLTDYQLLLHDSVEIEYIHTGYETNVGKGWVVTVDFALIEGLPALEPISITQLWNGSFPFGNAANPIENYLAAIGLTMDANAEILRIRMLQTGHGADNSNCAEFCQKTRYFKFNGTTAFTKNVWRLCGTNPVYPQGGTWIYNRANWCPGALVNPDIYDFAVTGGATDSVDVDMVAYTAANPSANYVFGSQAIQYKASINTNDASVEEVYQPNSIFEYSRMNPICDNSKVQLRNNSNIPLTSASFKYGLVGGSLSSYIWTGTLQPNKATDVTLPEYIFPAVGNQTFTAYIESVNGTADQYPYDDTIYSSVLIPIIHDTVFVFLYKTNTLASQTWFRMFDHNNQIVYSAVAGSLTANTIYRDTLYMPAGCYRFTLFDTGGDGLSFWANPGQGTGYARFLNMSGQIIKSFNADFGSEVSHNFLVDPASIVSVNDQIVNPYKAEVYPNPSSGELILDVIVRNPQDLKIEIINNLGQTVSQRFIENFSNDIITYDISSFVNGIYFVKISSDEVNETRKIVLEK